MRIATCTYNNQIHLAVVKAESVLLATASEQWSDDISSMLQLIDAGEKSLQKLQNMIADADSSEWIPLDQVVLLSPIPRPRQNIMCLGWNYIEHVEETSGKALEAPKLPKYPIVFTKAANSMNGQSKRWNWLVQLPGFPQIYLY